MEPIRGPSDADGRLIETQSPVLRWLSPERSRSGSGRRLLRSRPCTRQPLLRSQLFREHSESRPENRATRAELDFGTAPVDTSVMGRRGFSALGRAVAASAGLLAAILISACGGSTHVRSQPTLVHLDGRVTGDYVRETSAAGAGFLVPTGVLAAQGGTSFDIASPPPEDSNSIRVGPKLAYPTEAQTQRAWKRWFIGPSTAGTTPARAHVELLVTGDPGRRIYLSFEESCGFFHAGPSPKGDSAVQGAHGQRILRTPAVMMVPMLTSEPENACHVGGVVVTRGHNDLRISLIDY